MNGLGSGGKKTAFCRYFLSNGTCFYGDGCQFLHECPRPNSVTRKLVNHSSPQPAAAFDANDNPAFPTTDGMNGDQYFNATFGSTNGLPEFQPFSNRSKSARSSPLAHLEDPARMYAQHVQHPASRDNMNGFDPSLADRFGAMHLHNMAASQGNVLQADIKGRNPGASEFVPKSTNSLTHSASSPDFTTFLHRSTLGPGPHNPVHQQVASSPQHSPSLSPTNSPLIARRNKSPVPPVSTAPVTSEPQHKPIQQENVGGTTYFYTPEDIAHQSIVQGVVMPNFSMYPSIPSHISHMKLKTNMPSFFMPDELKMDLLNRHSLALVQMDPENAGDIPQEVDNYHCLFPLEPPPASPLQKSSRFGYPTTCYKAINSKDGLMYCLRRVHGFRLVQPKCMTLLAQWKKIQHSNIVSLREVFTTKAFGDHSMVFVYDFHSAAETLMMRHFNNPTMLNGYSNPYNLDGSARPYSAGKGASGPRQDAGLLSESLIWSYVVQLSSALRTIHAHGLACRVMDPTKILVTGKSTLRINCEGILDVLTFDANQANPLAMIPHYQQEDLVCLGKVVLALACNSVIAIQREHIQTSMDLVHRNYSADLKNLLLYLLSNRNQPRSVNDIMPMIGARFYTQLDAAQMRNDVLENELAKEVENGRLFRLISKLNAINERPEFNMDPSWSETGDRYMLKLFRDYVFHQVDENGAPWNDMSHIVTCMNKLDAGVPEKVCLMSRDEQSVLVVTYAELKRYFEAAFGELVNSSQESGLS